MKAIKKLSIDVSHQGYSPKFLPEIIKLCQDLNEKEAIIYQEAETKPFLFETSRLIIRRFYNDDVAGVHELANDRQESIMKNYDHQWPTDYKECKNVTDWLTTQENMWAVCIKPDFKLIGMITFNSVDENNMVDLGHVWHTKFWNDNLDTEAISLMVQYAFETLEVECVSANNPLECEQQIAPLKKIGMDITKTDEVSFKSDEYGNPIKFVGCNMVITKGKWNSMNKLHKTPVRTNQEDNPESYSPSIKPVILKLAEEINSMDSSGEAFVEQINDFCSIVERQEMKMVGITLAISYESRGYGGFYGFEHANCILNDYFFTKKLIAEGDIKLLEILLSDNIKNRDIITVRTNVSGDGNYKVIVGFEINDFDILPEYLPEYTETFTVPACRYAKILINETKKTDRIGYDERMHADEYFIGDFRNETSYTYYSDGIAFNTYDETGDIQTKYEPVKAITNDSERFDSFRFKVVSLPEMKIACSVTPPDSEEFVIFKYFNVQNQVFATEAAKYYLHDYYGFPTNSEQKGKINSCFGTRVSTFEGVPDCVEKIVVPGGIYLHITQLEVNGDNPSMTYDVAFNHIDTLFLSSHPQYERDWSRHVVARFRQANCASVFVPLSIKGKS